MRLKVVLRAPPRAVWRVVGDGFGDFARWSGGAVVRSRLDAAAPAVGATRTSHLLRPMLGQHVVAERLTEWRPSHGYAYELVEAPPGFRRAGNRWTVAPHRHGTLLTIEPFAEAQHAAAWLRLAAAGLRARPLARRMAAEIERLAAQRL